MASAADAPSRTRIVRPHLRILGIRGIPARHGGFETFTEKLAPYLVRQGWKVTVYCQDPGSGPIYEDLWSGVRRVHIPSGKDTPWSTIAFDLRANLHARREEGITLTLGYNTAVFIALLRRKGIRNVINMDGIEYARAKWGPLARLWLRLNERAAIKFADHLIADHPEIKEHLSPRAKGHDISVISYGSDRVTAQSAKGLQDLGLEPGKYLSVIARPEPENSLLEIVRAFSAKRRGVSLAVLGNYCSDIPYHRAVKSAASEEVLFFGAVYDRVLVSTIRSHSLAYIHGHQVGGSNPSLIEALGAGNPIIAHDNRFNRWVAGPGARFFRGLEDLESHLSAVLENEETRKSMHDSSLRRHAEAFTWDRILTDYSSLLAQEEKLAYQFDIFPAAVEDRQASTF